jgi:hypothetical protein
MADIVRQRRWMPQAPVPARGVGHLHGWLARQLLARSPVA